MMCKNPYIRVPTGIKRVDTILSSEARLASTPFPCGQCMHCRINKSREWKHRIMLESMSHLENSFVTLTYDDEHVPGDNSVSPKEITLFLKRLRKALHPERFRYFIVGEYGETSYRPHYHACLFGVCDFDTIDKAWGKGFIQIGELNPRSAGYCCGYILKGMTSKKDERLKEKKLSPEFMRCSKMTPGGLGIETLKQIAEKLKKAEYGKDIAIRTVRHGKKEYPLGKYLTNKLIEFAELNPETYECDFYDHVQDYFDRHLDKDYSFKEGLISDDIVKMEAREHNDKVYSRRRKL